MATAVACGTTSGNQQHNRKSSNKKPHREHETIIYLFIRVVRKKEELESKNQLHSIMSSTIPTSIISGTIAYLLLGVILIGVVFSSRASGMLNKDNAAIANVVVTIAVTSMWLFWLCAWMHQWHPLIVPIYEG